MRPERLELEGFGPFRERTEIDFADYDPLVFTPPIGGSMDILVDAIMFALYGAIPRYDRRQAGALVAKRAFSGRVRLDFAIGAARFSVVRTVRVDARRNFTTVARLERGREEATTRSREAVDRRWWDERRQERQRQELQRAERDYEYHRARLGQIIREERERIEETELNGAERERRILPVWRGKLARNEERLTQLSEDHRATVEAIRNRKPPVNPLTMPAGVLADSPSEVDTAIEDLVGFTFDLFARCVVLPHAEFARFLHAQPSEGGDLLVALLDLGVFDRVAMSARVTRAQAEAQISALDRLLEVDQAGSYDSVERSHAREAESARLYERRSELASRAETAKALSGHLKPDRFEKWLLQLALPVLVHRANVHLKDLTEARYSLAVDDAIELYVIDHHMSGSRSPVGSLSPQELDLVAFAMALALSWMSSPTGEELDLAVVDGRPNRAIAEYFAERDVLVLFLQEGRQRPPEDVGNPARLRPPLNPRSGSEALQVPREWTSADPRDAPGCSRG